MKSIFGIFARKKMEKTVTSITDGIMSTDLDTAGEAELEAIQNKLSEYSTKLAGYNQAYEREQREADAAQQNYDREYAIAKNLMDRVDAATDDAAKASLNASLTTQMTKLQNLKPVVEREKREAEAAKKLRDQYQNIVSTVGAKVRNRKAAIAEAKGRLDSAKVASEQNKELLEAARVAQGLASEDDGSVLGMLNRLADKEEAASASLNIQAGAINPEPEPVDENIAAATAEVTGANTSKDPRDLLASLKM